MSPFRLTINPAAEQYRHAYRWWRKEARASKDPKTCIHYALGQIKLARAMDANPRHFETKPSHLTDWQRYQQLCEADFQ